MSNFLFSAKSGAQAMVAALSTRERVLFDPGGFIPQRPLLRLLQCLLVFVAYFLSGRLGLSLPYIGSHITLIWPPTGIAVALLFRWGCGIWPGVAAGALLVNLSIGSGLPLAAGITLGNTAGPLAAAWLLKRLGFNRRFLKRSDVAVYCGAVTCAMAICASNGVAMLSLAGVVSPQQFAEAWLMWWLGDSVGALIVGPVLLTVKRMRPSQVVYGGTEFVLLAIVTVAAAWLSFLGPSASAGGATLSLAFLTLIPAIWAAMRFGAFGASFTALLLAGAATWATAAGRGQFSTPESHVGLLLLWGYVATVNILSLAITAVQAERSQAERALRESEERFRLLISDVREYAILSLSPEGVVTSWNAGAAAMFGYEAEQIIGSDYRVFFPTRATSASRPDAALANALACGRSEDEGWRLRKDGSTFWANAVLTRLESADGRLVGFSKVVRDLTERKLANEAVALSEERLRLAVDAIDEALWDWDISARELAYLSPRLYTMLGYEAHEFPAQLAYWHRLTNPEDFTAAWPALREQLQWGKGEFQFQFRLRAKDGSWRWIHTRGKPVAWNEEGRPLRIVGTHADITPRKHAEEEIRRLNDGLELRVAERTVALTAAMRELESFSYATSHDLRSPLRGIEGFSCLLAEEYGERLDDQGKDYLRRIRAGVKRMGSLIDDLLELSRLSRLELARQHVDLSEIARSVAHELRELEPQREVEVCIAEGLVAQADPVLVRAALHNLLGNAWKFTSRTQAALIEVGRETVEGGSMFFVRDNGAGFDMAYADKLFRPFQRLHATAEFPGNGVGLATVHRIINRHGGQLFARGMVGSGASFHFSLG